MNTFRTSVISLVAGIAFGFLIHNPVHPTETDPNVISLDYLCREIADQERVQRKIFHDYDAVPLPECYQWQRRAEPGPSFIERLLAWFSGKSNVASSDQPKSIASTP